MNLSVNLDINLSLNQDMNLSLNLDMNLPLIQEINLSINLGMNLSLQLKSPLIDLFVEESNIWLPNLIRGNPWKNKEFLQYSSDLDLNLLFCVIFTRPSSLTPSPNLIHLWKSVTRKGIPATVKKIIIFIYFGIFGGVRITVVNSTLYMNCSFCNAVLCLVTWMNEFYFPNIVHRFTLL